MKLSTKEFDAMQMGWRKWYIEKMELKTFKKFGLSIKGLDILEVGCGSGYAASLLTAEQPNSYTGLDIMPEQLEIARGRNLPGACFVEGSADDLSRFPDGSFDAVFSNYVYHNIPSRDRQAILLETLRVLKKGGTFAIHDLFSKDKYGDMQSFVKKLKDLGYERAELIPTDNGKFMSPWEAKWMALSGSALLVGKK